MRKMVNYDKNKRRLLTITAAAVTVILVVSVGIIGVTPLSVQQQGTGQTQGPRITSGNIVDGEVRNQDLADDAVTSDKIADGEVTSADIEDGTITSTDIAEGTIPPAGGGSTPDDNSVTSAKIVDGEVKNADIGPDAVESSSIRDSSITREDLANNAVTSDRIFDGTVESLDLANGAVTGEKVASGAIQPNIRIVLAPSITLSPSTSGISRADCPDGTILSGGGFNADGSIRITDSHPFSETTWGVVGFNESTFNMRLTAYALCIGPSP